jgi:hypothetical protein
MGAVWSLKLLPMVPNVTFSGYKFVPLLPYLERERPPLHGKNSLELGSCNAWGQNGLPRGLEMSGVLASNSIPWDTILYHKD